MPFRKLVDYHLLDLWISTHPLKPLRPALRRLGFIEAKKIPGKNDGTMVKVAGMLVMIHTPPIRSRRRVMFITLEDETGLIDLVAFEDVQRRWAKSILCSELLAVEGVVKKEGRSQKAISIIIRRILDPMPHPPSGGQKRFD